jgi:hypothetical protein
MTPEEPDDVAALWRAQTPETVHPTIEEMRQMERKMRRDTINFVVVLVLVSAGIVAIAVMFRHPLLTVGAIVSLAGFAFLAFEVFGHRRRAPVAEDGAAASVEYHQALLQHRLEFHRHRLWLRVLALAPGGVLFFLGFAAARPDLATLIYVELATFVVAVLMIVPVNRRAAAKLEAQIAQLTNLRTAPPPARR